MKLVCTAPLEWTSGYDYLLVTVRRLLDAGVDVALTIAADGPADQQVRYDIADMALGDTVTLTSRASCAAALAEADLFTLAALRGQSAGLVREAMAARLPVVAFDVPGLGQLVDQTVGALVPRRDTDALVGAIAGLAVDPAVRTALGDRAYQRESSAANSS